MSIAAVVADANVLLSAAIGKAALRVIVDYEVAAHVTAYNVAEVEEYLPRLSSKFGLPADLVQLQWRLIPVVLHEEQEYEQELPWAHSRLADRDPEDAHPLALARTLGLPVWSNDRDLQGLEVECLPTAVLLRWLEGG